MNTFSLPVYARRVLFLTSLVGLFASVYLLIVYTSGAPIVCGEGHGCDVVRASEWAYVFGVIPRPLLGVLFYVGVLGLLIVRAGMPQWLPVWLYRLTVLAAVVGLVESAHLFWIQYAYIEAFCNWCLVSGAATLVLFLAVWADGKAPLTPAQSLNELRWQFIVLAAALAAGVVGLVALL
jgi:uncharacterized membrane protein